MYSSPSIASRSSSPYKRTQPCSQCACATSVRRSARRASACTCLQLLESSQIARPHPGVFGSPQPDGVGVHAVATGQLLGYCSRIVFSQDLNDLSFAETALTHGGSPRLPVRRKSTIIFGFLHGADPNPLRNRRFPWWFLAPRVGLEPTTF